MTMCLEIQINLGVSIKKQAISISITTFIFWGNVKNGLILCWSEFRGGELVWFSSERPSDTIYTPQFTQVQTAKTEGSSSVSLSNKTVSLLKHTHTSDLCCWFQLYSDQDLSSLLLILLNNTTSDFAPQFFAKVVREKQMRLN